MIKFYICDILWYCQEELELLYTSSMSFANTVQLSASCNLCLAVCSSVFILSIFSNIAIDDAVSFSTYFQYLFWRYYKALLKSQYKLNKLDAHLGNFLLDGDHFLS